MKLFAIQPHLNQQWHCETHRLNVGTLIDRCLRLMVAVATVNAAVSWPSRDPVERDQRALGVFGLALRIIGPAQGPAR
jgi:hypothetical protein